MIYLKINGKALPVADFTWELRPGTQVYPGFFSINSERLKEFWPPSNPVTLEWITENSGKQTTIKFKNLYITDYFPGQGFKKSNMTRIDLVDLRWKWEYKKMGGRFNHLRRMNDNNILSQGETIRIPGEAAVSGFELGVAPGVTGGEGHFTPTQVQIVAHNLATPKTAFWKETLNPATEECWTALELAEAILNGYTVSDFLATGERTFEWPGILDIGEWGGRLHNLEDNNVSVSRLDYQGHDPRLALAEVLSQARANVAILPDGKCYLYPIDVPDLSAYLPPNWENLALETSVMPHLHDNVIQRPRAIDLLYTKEQEVMFYFSPYDDTDYVSRDSYVNNVVRTPLAFNHLGIYYEAGTCVPINIYLEYLKIDKDWLLFWWFWQDLPLRYHQEIIGGSGKPSPQTIKLIEQLKNDYMTLYKLSEEWSNRLVSLKPERVSLLDVASGKRLPSPVWCNYVTASFYRAIIDTQLEDGEAAEQFHNVDYDATADNKRPAPGELPSPYSVNIEDEQLGIFRISAGTDSKGIVKEIFLGNIEHKEGGPLPSLIVNATPASLVQCKLSDKFKLHVALTVVKATPNCPDQYYKHSITPESILAPNGVGPKAEVFIAGETARYDYEDKFVNEAMINNRSDAEAKYYYRTWADHYVGEVRLMGLVDIKPFANATIIYNLNGNYCTTTIKLPQEATMPPMENMMTKELRAIINNQYPTSY